MLKGAGAVVLLALLAVAVMGATAGIPDVVKARAFHVIAKDGTARVVLGSHAFSGGGEAGVIVTMNWKGQPIGSFAADESGNGVITTKNGILAAEGHE